MLTFVSYVIREGIYLVLHLFVRFRVRLYARDW
jgi:hypothetical protein